MLRNVIRQGKSIDTSRVKLFCESMKLELPEDYVAFLLKYNGGRPEPKVFPITGLPNNPFGSVKCFLSLDAAVESNDLEWNYDILADSVPRELIPIANTDGIDLVCLDLRKDLPPVLYFNMYPFWGNNIWREEYLLHIALDFSSFLQSLRHVDY